MSQDLMGVVYRTTTNRVKIQSPAEYINTVAAGGVLEFENLMLVHSTEYTRVPNNSLERHEFLDLKISSEYQILRDLKDKHGITS